MNRPAMASDQISNALGELEDDCLTVPLVCRKATLVHRSRWPAVASIGAARRAWQLDGLGADALDLLARIDAAPSPMVVAKDERSAAAELAARLLVIADEIHTDRGHHVKAYRGWRSWIDEHGVGLVDVDEARHEIEAIVARWGPTRRKLLPWQ